MSDAADVLRVRLGSRPRALIVGAWVLVAVCGISAVVNVVISWVALQPPQSTALAIGTWFPWLPFALFTVFFCVVAFSYPAFEFSSDRVVLRHSVLSKVILRTEVERLSVVRRYGDEAATPFPAMVMLESSRPGGLLDGSRAPVIAFQPGNLHSPELVETVLFELVAHCPPERVDPEVILVLALSHRVDDSAIGAFAGAVRPFDPHDPVVDRLLTQASTRAPAIAIFEYFLGNIERARFLGVQGLSVEPGAWDLLLCRALCERSLGDAAAYRLSLAAALAASPPPEIAPVLACALELT
jgi:hypothetical protein